MKTKLLLFLITLSTLISSCNRSKNDQNIELNDRNFELNDRLDSISYALGANMAQTLDMNSMHKVNYEAFIKGVYDVFEDKELKMDGDSLMYYINNFFKQLRAERSKINLEEGRAFMEENKNKEDILTTESGLQYKIIKEGTGRSPIATDIIRCQYQETTIDGTIFKSTYENGDTAEIHVNRLIPGWSEGVQLMKEGGKYKFFIPPELAYGQNVPRGGVIEPNMAVIIEVELNEVIMVGIKNKVR